MGRPKASEKPEEKEKREKPKATKVKKSKKVESDEDEEVQMASNTSTDNKDEIIARLEEKVKLLTIEVTTLRKHVDKISPKAPAKTPTPARKAGKSAGVADAPPSTPKGRRVSTGSNKPKERGCSCKGNCSKRICGCVKENYYCLPTCKCSDQCVNQDPDEDNEDKENDNDNTEHDIESASASASASSSSSAGESSPDVAKNERAKQVKNTSSRPLMEPPKEKEPFNPMAPSRQLERSPATTKSTKVVTKSKASHPAFNEIPLPPPKDEPEEEEMPPPEGTEDYLEF